MSQQHTQLDQLSTNGSSSPICDISRPAMIAGLLVLAGLLWPIVAGRIHTSDDLWKYHFPIRKFYANCLSRGDSFDWMPSVFCGYFLTGTGQAGTYHPWHWLLYKVLPLNAAFTLEITACYPFMLLGMRLFLRRWVKRSDSAWLGAIVFTLSGFCLLHFLHPNAIGVVSHIPWLLLTIDYILRSDVLSPEESNTSAHQALLRRNPWRAEMCVALLTASQLLLGYPQYVWYSLLAESIYCLVVAFREQSLRRAVKLLCLLAGLKLIGAGIGAVQVLPSMAALSESDRTSISQEEFNQHPLTPPDMLQWFTPYLTSTRVFGHNTHELAVYCGAIPFLLALAAMKRRGVDSKVRSLQIATLSLGLVALWLSFGTQAGLYSIQLMMPLIGKFRWPSRIVVLLHFCVAVLAAASFDRMASQPVAVERKTQTPARRRNGYGIYVVPLLSLLVSVSSRWWLPQGLMPPVTLVIVGPVLMLLAAVMIQDLNVGRCSAGFVLFVVGDLAVYGFTYEPLQKTESASVAMAQIEHPPGLPGDGRIMSQQRMLRHSVYFLGNQLTLQGWQLADGYEGLLPRIHFLEQDLTLNRLRIAGVRWVPSRGTYSDISGLLPSADPNWLIVSNPLPRVWLTNNVRQVPISAASTVEPQADGPTFVDENCDWKTAPTNEPNANSSPTDEGIDLPSEAKTGARILNESPGQIRIETIGRSQSLLVWNERFSSGWRVRIDGIDRPVVRTNFDFLGVVVPGGTHTIEFEFAPPSLALGKKISGASLLLLFSTVAIRRRRTRAKSEIVAAVS